MQRLRYIHGDRLTTAKTASAAPRGVELRFSRKDAAQVWSAGDFPGWSAGRLPMQRQADGWWAINAELPPGEYRFRYVASEQNHETWFTDFAAHGVEFAKGSWNSVLVVPAMTPAVKQVSMENIVQD